MKAKMGAVLAAAVLLAGGQSLADDLAARRRIAVGTGEVLGYYYPVGGAVCRMVNRDRVRHGIQCLVEPTAGTGANIAGLRNGVLDVAIVQSKAQSQAVNGSGPFEADGPFAKLRSLLALHSETLTALARKDSKIRSLSDLKKRTIALGPAGSFQRTMADGVLQANGWVAGDFENVLELDPSQQVEALCNGEVEAIMVTVVHPSAVVGRAVDECEARMLDVKGPAIAKYLSSHPYLSEIAVPAGTYARLETDHKSFGMTATLVTTTDLPADTAYEIVKNVVENLNFLQGMYPALANVDKEGITKNGLSAPLHEGAARYFKEAGLASAADAPRR